MNRPYCPVSKLSSAASGLTTLYGGGGQLAGTTSPVVRA